MLRARPLLVLLSLALAACPGGSDSGTGPQAAAVASVQVSPAPDSLVVGASYQLVATVLDESGSALTGRAVSWSSDRPAVAAVDAATGTVTAVSAGSASVRATSEGKSGSVTIRVGVPVAVASLALVPANIIVAVGETVQLDAVARDLQGSVIAGPLVTWSGGKAGFVTLNTTTGAVTGVAAMTAQFAADVTATSGGRQATGTVTVTSVPMTEEAITSGAEHACAVSPLGAPWCWGRNVYGSLGKGSLVDEPFIRAVSPVEGIASQHNFVALSSGGYHTLALTATGRIFAWGWNSTLALGDGTGTDRGLPVEVLGGRTYRAISAGGGHSCALTPAGAAYCWGANAEGQLGIGGTANKALPTPVGGGLVFESIAAGGSHTCGLTATGAAYCWGDNTDGQLGDGTTTTRTVPTPVAGGLTFRSIDASTWHSCGLTTDGAAYCWGLNADGQLGDGTTTTRTVPTPVAGGGRFRMISAGKQHTVALTPEGAAWAWGSNRYGQLGTGGGNTLYPAPVTGGLTFRTISAGGSFTTALTPAGEGYRWGFNVGSTNAFAAPTRIASVAFR